MTPEVVWVRAEADHLKDLELRALRERMDGLESQLAEQQKHPPHADVGRMVFDNERAIMCVPIGAMSGLVAVMCFPCAP